jgi:indolepyruvate ferredoxin oxidoreductase beta subunit
MKAFNIYMTGVGGQGIGMLSEILMRACDYAGYPFRAVDTHGLAQRGGIVNSQLRIGPSVYTPLIPTHGADLVVALERHEALRSLIQMASEGSTLIYYDTVWQPLDVRLGQAGAVSAERLAKECTRRGVELVRVFDPDLRDARMQNIAVLARMDRSGLVEGVTSGDYRQAMIDLMTGRMLERNMALFESGRSG